MLTSQSVHCWTCKRRRVVCDSQKPACKKCLDKGVECLGYGAKKPLVWVAGANARKPRRKKKDDAEPSGKDGSEGAVTEYEKKDKALSKIWDSSSPLSNSTVLGEFTVWVRSLEYFNQNIAPMSGLLNLPGSKQYVPVKYWRYLPALTLDLLSLMAWRHRRFKGRLSAEPLDHPGNQELELSIAKHTASALAEVNHRISHKKGQEDDITLFAVLSLFMTEVLHPKTGSWRIHLQGLRSLINLRGGLGKVLESWPRMTHLLAGFVLVEILMPTTLDLRKFNEPNLQAYYLPYLPSLLEGSIWTFFPCPVELICIMARINDLRSRILSNECELSSPNVQTEIRDIFAELKSYSPTRWAKAAAYMQGISSSLTEDEAFNRAFTLPSAQEVDDHEEVIDDTHLSRWVEVGTAYHAAMSLFFFRALFLPYCELESHAFGVNVFELRNILVEQLFRSADYLIATKDDGPMYRWFLSWPLLISGIETDPYDEQRKEIVRQRFDMMMYGLVMECYRNGRKFLEDHWDKQLQGLRDSFESWDTIFAGVDPLMLV